MLLLFKGTKFIHIIPDGAAEAGGDGFPVDTSQVIDGAVKAGGDEPEFIRKIVIIPDGAAVAGGDGSGIFGVFFTFEIRSVVGGDGFTVDFDFVVIGAAVAGGDGFSNGIGFAASDGGVKVGGDGFPTSVGVTD